jgi:uncharacterized protein (DUF2062 family)
MIASSAKHFFKIKGSPREIAAGFALGIVIGMSPFLGAHILACILIASLLGWSKLAALLGVNITNVFTAPIIYPINYWVGVNLIGFSSDISWSMPSDYRAVFEIVRQTPMILVDLFIGGCVLGIPLAIAGYFVSLRLINLCRK